MWGTTCIVESKKSGYTPTQDDVFAVRRSLLRFLPAELAVIITEYAQYWPSVSATREALTGPASIQSGWNQEWCYLLSPPIPSYPDLRTKLRRINFTILCEAECTYDGICSDSTVFEAAIIKSSDVAQNILLEPIENYPERQIHRWNITNPNRWLIECIDSPETAWQVGTEKKIVWGEPQEPASESVPAHTDQTDGVDTDTPTEHDQHQPLKAGTDPHSESLLRALTPGDRVAVMVRGLIPGWMNCIYTITTDIQYSI